jgi:outer membrane receptor protein involved in Fe transport
MRIIRTGLLAALLGTSTLSSVALAQDTGAQDTGANSAPSSAEIVVTGTRIKRPNDFSSAPILSATESDLKKIAGQTLGDVLGNLPALRTTLTFTNNNINVLDLRGLGSNRTLVLVNGRRQVGALEGSSSVDVETIPVALLERVDVVTGGASAVYGSDAVSGVVNFITRSNFDGVAVTGQGGLSSGGGAGSFAGSLTAGKNFADGRGNIAVSVEGNSRAILRNSQRSYASTVQLFSPNPAKQSDGDGLPFNVLYRDLRFPLISDGGTVLGNAFLQFQPDGSIRPVDEGNPALYNPGANAAEGGSGLNLNRYSLIQPKSDRVSANLLFSFAVSPALRLFAEGKFVRTNIDNVTQPTIGQSFLSIDNPYLTASSRAAILADAGGPVDSFLLLSDNSGLGLQQTQIQRDLFRTVVGAKGDLGNDISYELSYVHGETQTKTRLLSARVTQRFDNAVDAVADTRGILGRPGEIVCRATLDAGSRSTGNYDIDACQPVNLFGEGNVSDPARNYINATLGTRLKLTQDVVTAYITGTTRSFLNLPGGPIAYAVGAEYRREASRFTVPDALNAVPNDKTGINLYRDALTFRLGAVESQGSLVVKEAFGEVSLPLFSNQPLLRELTVDGAFRVANYNIAKIGTVNTWKAGIQYRPISDLRLRLSYSQAIRAPNINELFAPTQAAVENIIDPCDVTRRGAGSANRAANCIALGLPAGFDVASRDTTQVIGQGSGNRNLSAETSRSLTFGAVLTPSFLPGFAISLDYYRIRIRNAVALLSAQESANLCVDSPSVANDFCALIVRSKTSAVGAPAGSIIGFTATARNYASLEAEGVDLDLRYTRQINGIGNLALRAIGTYVLKRNDFPFIENPTFINQTLLEVGDPRLNVNFNADLRTGRWNFGYGVRYISSQFLTDVENVKSVGGLPPQQPNIQDILETGNKFYHDARVSYSIGEGSFFLSVSNLFNSRPPVGAAQTTVLSDGRGVYDSIGRYFTFGFSAKF